MSKQLVEETYNQSERVKEVTVAATDQELLNLMQKFSGFEVPPKVVMQAMAIATYDCASAFRYADNYLNILKNKKHRKKLLLLESAPEFCIHPRYVGLRNC
jgi:hypothetical protein